MSTLNGPNQDHVFADDKERHKDQGGMLKRMRKQSLSPNFSDDDSEEEQGPKPGLANQVSYTYISDFNFQGEIISFPKKINDKIKMIRLSDNEKALLQKKAQGEEQITSNGQEAVEETRVGVLSKIKRQPGQTANFQSIDRNHISQLKKEQEAAEMPAVGQYRPNLDRVKPPIAKMTTFSPLP